MTISRRQFLSASLATGVASTAFPSFSDGASTPFQHGVASGDPTSNAVIIWTRLTVAQSTKVTWQVSADKWFSQVVQSGTAPAFAEKDYTVKVDVSGLEPGETYYYRFVHKGLNSEIGRTKTLPIGEVTKLNFAVVSCSNYPFGFFNAYEHIALNEQLDFVLHLGDYIYEYGQNGWGADSGKKLGREHSPSHEIISLRDYRTRHAQYKADKASRLMHAAHPLIPTWDDHESANNPYKYGAQNHQPNEGDWLVRQAASIQAYYEWMPIREPAESGDIDKQRRELWRHYQFGNLATLCTLETRHTGRDKQLDYGDYLDELHTVEQADTFIKEVINNPERKMLSDDMLEYVSSQLTASKNLQQPWRLIANQIPIAKVNVPPLDDLLVQRQTKGYDPVAAEHARFVKQGKLNLPLYLDTWDGYGGAREAFYQMCQQAGCNDLVVLTGDSHSFWANELFSLSGDKMGVEIGTAGVTSPGDFESYGKDIAIEMDRRFAVHNQEVLWTDNMHRGYVKVSLTPTEGTSDFIAVSSVTSSEYFAKTIRRYAFKPAKGTLEIGPR